MYIGLKGKYKLRLISGSLKGLYINTKRLFNNNNIAKIIK